MVLQGCEAPLQVQGPEQCPASCYMSLCFPAAFRVSPAGAGVPHVFKLGGRMHVPSCGRCCRPSCPLPTNIKWDGADTSSVAVLNQCHDPQQRGVQFGLQPTALLTYSSARAVASPTHAGMQQPQRINQYSPSPPPPAAVDTAANGLSGALVQQRQQFLHILHALARPLPLVTPQWWNAVALQPLFEERREGQGSR